MQREATSDYCSPLHFAPRSWHDHRSNGLIFSYCGWKLTGSDLITKTIPAWTMIGKASTRCSPRSCSSIIGRTILASRRAERQHRSERRDQMPGGDSVHARYQTGLDRGTVPRHDWLRPSSTSSPCEMRPVEGLESTRLDTETMTVCKKAGKCGTIQEEFKERWKRIPPC